MPCLCCETEETALTGSMKTARCCQRVCKTHKLTIWQQSATVTQHYEGASGQESAASDSTLTGQLQWTTAVPMWRSAWQRCTDWSGRGLGAAQLYPAIGEGLRARTVRCLSVVPRHIPTNQHTAHSLDSVLGMEERVVLQLLMVGRQRGGYSHRMSPRASQMPKVPPSSAKRENLPASRRTHKPSPIACSTAAIFLRSAACPAP